ncbi:carboxylesterase [Bosea sp. WAO]|uniref:alpha/beta fold hydrolase n=1 Tax=Bosea sp. WAO TaxID=406341 RepID=UPI00074A9C20|nr:alpha/beta hydrolase [Bosea sp. WAO]KUL97476.1 carboxylesterase [Bosea sp. WAO]
MSGAYRKAGTAAAVQAHYRQILDQCPVPCVELHVATRQGSTFVLACGPEDAPPVVLLHGSQANSAAWLLDVPLWSTKFRLFAVDMIGEPGLSAQVRPALASDAHALWLDDVFAALGLSQAALVGMSLGGWLALDYASRRPGFAQALALICPAGIGRQKNFLPKALPLLLLGRWGKRKARELVLGPFPKVLPEAVRPLAEFMEHIGRVVRPRMVAIPCLSDTQLAGLGVPVLSIIGGRDALLDSRDTQERLRCNVPQAEVCFIEGGYHFLPDQTARVMGFLERALAPS